MATVLANATIINAYRDRTPGSERLAREAAELFPSGITHDARYLEPYAVYVDRAEGPHKWDVDGNRYVDYFGGHGALLLGHSHPEVVAAMQAQAAKGTHFGASHELEVRWAQLIKRLVPSAERVRFTASGTEATHMALRLARAFTGRDKVVRFRANFHGWHDHMTSGYSSNFDGSPTPGVLGGIAQGTVLLDPGDTEGVRRTLAERDDVAAVILEPTGGSWGKIPIRPEFLVELRRLTTAHGVLLIFDEVVTGFRVAPGGAQAAFGVTPDLTTLAKVVAGGAPGGAVVGRRDVMDELDFAASAASGRPKIEHPGTFNANPISAAAGIAALTVIAETDACERANASGAYLREALNELFEAEGLPWAAYGGFSMFHLFLNPQGREGLRPTAFDPLALPYMELKAQPKALLNRLRLALLVNGVDIAHTGGGVISAAHGRADLDETVDAFKDSIRMLRREGALPA